MIKTPAVTFDRKTRNAVCKASEGLPKLGTFLTRISALGNPLLTEAIDGIWCGKEGRVTLDLPGSKSLLCFGWYRGNVEWAYIS